MLSSSTLLWFNITCENVPRWPGWRLVWSARRCLPAAESPGPSWKCRLCCLEATGTRCKVTRLVLMSKNEQQRNNKTYPNRSICCVLAPDLMGLKPALCFLSRELEATLCLFLFFNVQEGEMCFSEELFLDHKSSSMRQFLQSAVHLQFFKQVNKVDVLPSAGELRLLPWY